MRIALFEPDIPQNTGNIFRLSACLGIPVDIIEPTGFIFDDKRFKRALMDYIKFINYKRHLDWKEFYQWSLENKFRLVLLTTKSKKNYTKFRFKKNDTLLFGRESAGVPEKIHKKIKYKIKIPMIEKKRSLNLSTSVAIALSENIRQTGYLWTK